jgi:hypothetical protein
MHYRHYLIEGVPAYGWLTEFATNRFAVCLTLASTLARLYLIKGKTSYLSRLAYFTGDSTATAVCVVQAGRLLAE